MEEKNISSASSSSENIFEDFLDSNTPESTEQEEEQAVHKKTKFDYFRYLISGMYVLNTFLFVLIVLFTLYVFIQNNEKKINLSFAQSFCGLFLGSKEILGNNCTGVSSVLQEFESKTSSLKQSQSSNILPVLRDYYSYENFKFSERVTFLLRKSFSRLEPSMILNAFDTIKRDFTGVDTGNIECYNISISDTSFVTLECDVYSSDWDTNIIDIRDQSKTTLAGGGTSISRANSFIHFIENHESKNFRVVNQPDEFSVRTIENGPYTKVTQIKLGLQFIDTDSLSF